MIGSAEKVAQEKFRLRLPDRGNVLDFGDRQGGSGFLDPHYPVTPLCEQGKLLLTHLCENGRYDGIWTGCAGSFLPKEELIGMLRLITYALKREGVVYLCFPEGDFEGREDGRYRTEFTVRSFRSLLSEAESLKLDEVWFEQDDDGRKMNLLLIRAA